MDPYGPSARGWRIERLEGLTWIVCDQLSALPGLGHAFSTRLGPGGAEFDLGAHDACRSPFQDRRRRLCSVAGLTGQRPLLLQQVHGARVATATEAAEGEPLLADGIVALRGEASGLAAAVRTADCVPILLADSAGSAVAAVHAGWRGTAEAIASRAVALLESRGLSAESLIAAIGPAIGPCCYEVAGEVADRVARATGVSRGALVAGDKSRPTLDLPRANRLQLQAAGLSEGAIQVAPWCTACHGDLFYSYRRQGGPTGRLMACIGWAAP